MIFGDGLPETHRLFHHLRECNRERFSRRSGRRPGRHRAWFGDFCGALSPASLRHLKERRNRKRDFTATFQSERLVCSDSRRHEGCFYAGTPEKIGFLKRRPPSLQKMFAFPIQTCSYFRPGWMLCPDETTLPRQVRRRGKKIIGTRK